MLVRMQGKRISFALLVAMQAGAATLENSMEVPQKIKNKTTSWLSNSITRYLSKGYRCAVSKRHMHPMFIAALSRIAQVWEEPKCPSMDEWIKKRWYIYTMEYIYSNNEYYSAIKKNETLPFATMWMELKSIMLSEISQRKTNLWLHSYEVFKTQTRWT